MKWRANSATSSSISGTASGGGASGLALGGTPQGEVHLPGHLLHAEDRAGEARVGQVKGGVEAAVPGAVDLFRSTNHGVLVPPRCSR